MSIHRSYAKALFEVIKEKKLGSEYLKETINELEIFQSWIESSEDAKKIFLGALIHCQEKVIWVSKISQKIQFSNLTSHFLQLICRKNRVQFLSKMIQELKIIHAEAEGYTTAQLVTAEALNSNDQAQLDRLFKLAMEVTGLKSGHQINYQVSSDPSLLAGIQVNVNGVTYDGSLRSQLQRLKEKFVS